MADITLCGNSDNCPKRDSCYRALIPPSHIYQSYCNFYQKDKLCDYYGKYIPRGTK